MTSLCRLFALLMLLGVLTAAGPVRAMDLYSYDLDSLVYLSSDVVDADVVSAGPEGGLDITRVKVTHTYLGHFHSGDTVKVTALDFFSVSHPQKNSVIIGEGGRRLGVGDHMTLFLAKAKSVFLYDIPKDANIYWPAPSGVKMEDEGRVKGFEQYCNPGPYSLQWTTPETLKRLPTPAEFQAQLAASIRLVEPLRPLLTKAVMPADKPALLTLLRQRGRPANFRWNRDAISEAACDQIVSLHSLDAVADALAITSSRNLMPPLQTPPGRDFLLKVIGDTYQPLARRQGCLDAAGVAYAWWDDKANSDYVSRLVALCWKVRATPDLTETLLDQLDLLAQLNVGGSSNPPAHPANLQIVSGLPTLRNLHDATKSAPVRFAVEKLIWKVSGYGVFQTLASPCGPVLSLAQPPRSLPGASLPSPTSGKLLYQSTIRWADPTWRDAHGMTTHLVLVNIQTRTRTELPPGREVSGEDSMEDRDETMQADLSSTLPHGRYRVFLEFARPGQPVSVGYGYEASL